ncbi:hypothetical protein TNCV_4108271 [Trichonephila clavipes]|nr:hypothetical protein TNCV_4108271 [Trichonephila clavipes]
MFLYPSLQWSTDFLEMLMMTTVSMFTSNGGKFTELVILWNEEKYLRIAPGEANIPRTLLFDEHAEEFSFPAIYLGHS